MGTLDFLKDVQGKVIDAATYQLLERNFQMQSDNNQLLSEKAVLLQETVATQRTRIAELEKEIAKLKSHLAGVQQKEEFRIYKGMCFKKKANGKFSDEPYCPHCRRVMGVMEGFLVTCSPCKHTVTLDNKRLPEIAVWLDENPE